MRCPHCLVQFYATCILVQLIEDAEGKWAVENYKCPNPECEKASFYLINAELKNGYGGPYIVTADDGTEIVYQRELIRPKGSNRPPVPKEVPVMIAEDYTEACIVLPDSAKASAALSRRCLQNLLRLSAGVKKDDLAREIQQVLDSNQLPSHLADSIDAIRNIGNYAAHPLKSQSTGEILEVEPGEAEWNLEVLEMLFDFYYVQPEKAKQRRLALNAKLNDAGKPNMK